jgi:hypothetical protein
MQASWTLQYTKALIEILEFLYTETLDRIKQDFIDTTNTV